MTGLRGLLAVALLMGAACVAANPTEEARITDLGARIRAAPGNSQLYIQRALAYSNAGQPGAALADIEQAERLGKPVDAAFARGILTYRDGDFAAARACFDRYLASYPDDTAAREYRFRLLRDSGDYPAALEDYGLLVAAGVPLGPGLHVAAAHMTAETPGLGSQAALDLLDRRMAELGSISVLQRAAIELERGRGNYRGALARMGLLDQSLRATPEWQLDVAELLLADGQPGEALMHLDLAGEQLQSRRRTAASASAGDRLDALREQAGQRLADQAR